MTEKINNILFHPSTLSQFRKTNIFKVLLYLLFLSIFLILVPIIDIVKDPEYDITDKQLIEQTFNFDFNVAKTLPNCSLKNNIYSCSDEESKNADIGSIFGIIKIVSDENNESQGGGIYQLKFTQTNLQLVDQFGFRYTINYEELPSKWQEFDFVEIKNSANPSDSLYYYFIGGLNQIIVKLTPLIILFNIAVSFIIKLLELIIFSLFFFLLYRRYQYKYRELFKISVFAQSLPITLSVIFSLLRLTIINSFFITLLTFIYVHIAILHNAPKDKEF